MRIPSALTVVLLTVGLTGCSDGDTPVAAPASSSPAPVTEAQPGARDELAGLAALALDRRYAALYSLTGDGTSREVVASVAEDGTWRVDIPNGALGGTTGVTVIRVATGLYQCTLSTAALPVSPTCVRVAEKGDKVPRKYDPRIQRLFRQWLTVLTDQRQPLAVSAVQPLEGAEGTCYSVDSVTASLDAPIDVGVYCYSTDGLLTAARVDFGTLKLIRQVAGPPTLQLPGPEVAGLPMGMTAQPTGVAPSS
ncbi:MAG TPA: hypothetical protein VN408_16535 [Actinoplanes sp.]|nr:hypothetical protein [Actinoplanes sp.]